MGIYNSILLEYYNRLDGAVKFPYLKEGSIGIQIGFDLSSKNLTSDLFIMSQRVGKSGMAVGIDPDPENHRKAQAVIDKHGIKNILLIEMGTLDEPSELTFHFAQRASHNFLEKFDPEISGLKTNGSKTVKVDRLDRIIESNEIDVSKIRHVNITNNGAEYATLKGMNKTLAQVENMSISVTSGRPRSAGIIDGKQDYEAINELFADHGFQSKYYRITDLFWWSVFKKLIVKRTWIFGKKTFGVVLAYKGKQSIGLLQSYS